MFNQENFLEKSWDDLLSRDPKRIKARFDLLDQVSQTTVLEHLTRMVSEEGWHPEQRKSAQAALENLNR